MEFLQNNFLTDFFVMCMKGLNSMFASYAVSIVVLTVLIRLAMLPLDIKQRENQRKMSALGPEIESLKKRYANNPQQLQRKQQEMYRKMNVRPMMGCLPMLIQLPFLFAFFGAMRVLQSEQMMGLVLDAAQFGANTVTLPQFLWVHNFWQPDSGLADIMPMGEELLRNIQQNMSTISPATLSLMQSHGILTFTNNLATVNVGVYDTIANNIIAANGLTGFKNGWFILPVLSGAALLLQQKFAPQSGANPMAATQDPEQQQAQGCSNKVMMWVFPIFSVYICSTSNAAFALYWFVSSIYAFGQARVVEFVRKRRDKGTEVTVA